MFLLFRVFKTCSVAIIFLKLKVVGKIFRLLKSKMLQQKIDIFIPGLRFFKYFFFVNWLDLLKFDIWKRFHI